MTSPSPLPEHHTWTHNPLVRQLQEENDRLRGALQKITKLEQPEDLDGATAYHIAIAALSEGSALDATRTQPEGKRV